MILLYFIDRTTFKCHQKGQNLEKSRYVATTTTTTTQNSAGIFGPLEVVGVGPYKPSQLIANGLGFLSM